jgi:NAD(P)-dependent dehydrogenase (short-subunit alcohol dehydrogenase family)
MPGSLSGQILIMTGGAMDFGECMAKAVAQEGASVLIADVNVPEAERVVDAINTAGGTAMAVEML